MSHLGKGVPDKLDVKDYCEASWLFLGNDASVEKSAFPFDLISALASRIKEQASFAHYHFAFEPQMLRGKSFGRRGRFLNSAQRLMFAYYR